MERSGELGRHLQKPSSDGEVRDELTMDEVD